MAPLKDPSETKLTKAASISPTLPNGVEDASQLPANKAEKLAAKKRRRDDHEVEPTKASISRRRKPRAADEHAPGRKGEIQPLHRTRDSVAKRIPTINTRPSQKLDVFVFGSGSFGELGLGNKKFEGRKPEDVKRPRLNHNLLADKVGVVQVACGGMHAVALTADNKVLTWGVNDDMALGRESSLDPDSISNLGESTPGEVDFGSISATQFVQVAATDSASFVLCEDGLVYGWGTFRASDGILGFTQDIKIQPTPILISSLKNITSLAGGSNHMLALDKDGKVWSWGSGGQLQLGRKHVARHGGPRATLDPRLCGHFTKRNYAVKIGAGSYHSFYIDNKGMLWSWGLNNYSQTGHADGSGDADCMIPSAMKVPGLRNVIHVDGGEHHSAACAANGELFTWGRIDGHQVGLSEEMFTKENTIFDERSRPRILFEPTAIPDLNASFVATGTDTTIAITADGRAYTWGFSASWQTGEGTQDDVELPMVIETRRVLEKKLI
ncbi:RCC1/BLIP-II [Xylaria cf. heliscus]|nr:RCC1/BLIP-II [Xylaria cf. heliscus]